MPQYDRTRSLGQFASVPGTYAGGPSGTTVTYSGALPATFRGRRVEMTDRVTPGYRQVIERGGVVNSPLSIIDVQLEPFTGVSFRHSGAAWETDSGGLVSVIFGSILSGMPAPGAWMPSTGPLIRTGRIATNAAWADVSKTSSLSWVTALEARKSKDSLVDLARKVAPLLEKLVTTIRACKKGDLRTLERLYPGKRTFSYPKRVVLWDERGIPVTTRKGNTVNRYARQRLKKFDQSSTDEAARLWMQYRYGISPIIYDMTDHLKAAYAEDLRESLLPHVTSVARGSSKDNEETSTNVVGAVGGISYGGNTFVKHEIETRAFILYREARTRLLQRLHDFGIFNIPMTLWELTPLSFVVDWFIPVGDYIQAITPDVGVSIIGSGYSQSIKTSIIRTVSSQIPPTYGWSPFAPLGAADKAFIKRKTRSPGLASPGFPPPQVNLTWKRLVDAAAMMNRMR